MSGRYSSIIGKERVYSEKHPQMSNRERAAQFAPFAALNGYDEAVAEMARLTAERISLSDDSVSEIDRKLRLARQRRQEKPEITIVFFRQDEKKSGGAYITKTGHFAGIKEYSRTVLFTDGTAIPIQDIYDITGKIFDCLDE